MPPFPVTGPRPFSPARRRFVAGCAAALAAAPAAPRARADVIPFNAAELRVEEGEVLLTADFALAINATLEEALQRGIPLYFVLDVEIVRPRWYWFDEKAANAPVQHRVSWQPLTRQYRLASGLLTQSFDSLAEVERLIGRVNSRAIARVADLERGARYEVVVRLRLDVNQLPKPFQVNALASRDWQLASEPRRIAFVAP
ncbi:MAG: DUF4390 domain-containing protein [Betaproteobacteria bacterium]|jgi:hypothetical protein|nr:DUF4390 domain-containing protein [Betaproteobacteria bacterium]